MEKKTKSRQHSRSPLVVGTSEHVIQSRFYVANIHCSRALGLAKHGARADFQTFPSLRGPDTSHYSNVRRGIDCHDSRSSARAVLASYLRAATIYCNRRQSPQIHQLCEPRDYVIGFCEGETKQTIFILQTTLLRRSFLVSGVVGEHTKVKLAPTSSRKVKSIALVAAMSW